MDRLKDRRFFKGVNVDAGYWQDKVSNCSIACAIPSDDLNDSVEARVSVKTKIVDVIPFLLAGRREGLIVLSVKVDGGN